MSTTPQTLAATLELRYSTLSPPQRGVLLLVRMGAELGRWLAQDEHDAADLARVRVQQLALIVPDADERILPTVDRALPLSNLPEWLADEDVGKLSPYALMVGLLTLLPPGRTPTTPVWGYLRRSGELLGVDEELWQSFLGWLKQTGDQQSADTAERFLTLLKGSDTTAAALAEGFRRRRGLWQSSSAGARYLYLREELIRYLPAVEDAMQDFHVDRSRLLELQRYLAANRLRMAVLGEFNRGKSSVVNVLAGTPELMPTSVLPATSALTELIHGDPSTYEVNDAGPMGSFRPSTEEAFREGVANASRSARSSREAADRLAEAVPYWRVGHPSPFLARSRVALVDTPGLGEDHARDRIARLEALRADAAVLVFDAQQQASLTELELVESMRSKARDLFILVNKADVVDEADWPRIQEFVLGRLREVSDGIEASQVMLTSASRAEAALRAGNRADPWLERLTSLRERLVEHLLAREGAVRLAVLVKKAREFIEDARQAVTHLLLARQAQVQDLDSLARSIRESEERYLLAQTAILRGRKALADGRDGTRKLQEALHAAMPALLEEAHSEEAQWTSERNPRTSPKKHAEEVAEAAKRSVLRRVEAWMQDEGSAILAGALEERQEAAHQEAEDFLDYLKKATGRDEDDLYREILAETLGSVFPELVPSMSSGGVVTGVLVGGAISAVVGYVIADVVLFYMLGLVAGFFNPAILAGAVVVGMAVYGVFGADKVRAWIRGQIFAKIRESLLSDARKAELNQRLEQAVQDLFTKVAVSFEHSAGRVLEEVREQQRKTEEEMLSKQESLGSPDALREELARLSGLAAQVNKQLDEVERLVSTPPTTLAQRS